MPVQGILSSDAAFSQANFEQLKQQVEQGTANRTEARREYTQAAANWFPPPTMSSGPGGTPPMMWSPQSMNQLIRQVQADGYAALKISDIWPQYDYQGHMLSSSFHQLDPVFGGLNVNYSL